MAKHMQASEKKGLKMNKWLERSKDACTSRRQSTSALLATGESDATIDPAAADATDVAVVAQGSGAAQCVAWPASAASLHEEPAGEHAKALMDRAQLARLETKVVGIE